MDALGPTQGTISVRILDLFNLLESADSDEKLIENWGILPPPERSPRTLERPYLFRSHAQDQRKAHRPYVDAARVSETEPLGVPCPTYPISHRPGRRCFIRGVRTKAAFAFAGTSCQYIGSV